MKFSLQTDLYSATLSCLQAHENSASERYRRFKVKSGLTGTDMEMTLEEIKWVLSILSEEFKNNPDMPQTPTSINILVQTWINISTKATEREGS